MRKAQRNVDLLPSDLRAIADPVNLKRPAKALANALRHIGNQLSRKAVQSPHFTIIHLSFDSNNVPLDFDFDPRRYGRLQFPLRSFLTNFFRLDGNFDPAWNCDGLISNTRHCTHLVLDYHTEQMSSPPTFAFWASRSTMIPFGVDRMLIPNPFLIGVTACAPT